MTNHYHRWKRKYFWWGNLEIKNSKRKRPPFGAPLRVSKISLLERKNFRKVFVALLFPSWEKDAGASSPELPKSSCAFACCSAVSPYCPPNCVLRKKRLCLKGLCFIIIFYILSILFTKLIFYNSILCLQNLLIFLYKIQNSL